MKTMLRKTILSILAAAPMIASATVPTTLQFAARLADNGRPVNGSHSFTFTLWNDPAATADANKLWTETQSGVAVSNGVAAATLGSATAIDPTIFAGGAVYLEVMVDATTLAPRIQMLAAPYALRASVAESMNAPLSCQDVSNPFTLAAGGGGCPSVTFFCCNIITRLCGLFCSRTECDSPSCPAGYSLTGGGYALSSSSVAVTKSVPGGDLWSVAATNNDGVNAQSMTVYGHCCKVP